MNKFVNRKKSSLSEPPRQYIPLSAWLCNYYYTEFLGLSFHQSSLMQSLVCRLFHSTRSFVLQQWAWEKFNSDIFIIINSIFLPIQTQFKLHKLFETDCDGTGNLPPRFSNELNNILLFSWEKWFMNLVFKIESTEYLWLNFFHYLRYFAVASMTQRWRNYISYFLGIFLKVKSSLCLSVCPSNQLNNERSYQARAFISR